MQNSVASSVPLARAVPVRAMWGVFDRKANLVHFFERVPGGEYRAPVSVHGLSDSIVRDQMTPEAYARMVEELAMLDGAGAAFDHAAVLDGGRLTVG